MKVLTTCIKDFSGRVLVMIIIKMLGIFYHDEEMAKTSNKVHVAVHVYITTMYI